MELLIANPALSWLCLVALFAFAELFFLQYRFLWFSVGCTAGLATALCSGPLWLQIVISAVSTGALMWFTRSWVKQVRCDDAIHEFVPEESAREINSIRFDRNAGAHLEEAEGSLVASENVSVISVPPKSEEDINFREELTEI